MKKFKRVVSLMLTAGLTLGMLAGCGSKESDSDTIKIGLLFSNTGTTSISEGVQLAATEMAIDEINAAGGIAGRTIEYVHEDIQSDAAVSAEKAKKLILEDNITYLFGAMSSNYRQAVLPVVEEYNAFLFYSSIYEGQEDSPNIVYCAAVPNQIVPIVCDYVTGDLGKKKVFIIGSDYVYAQLLGDAFNEYLEANGSEVVGVELVPLGQTDFSSLMTKISSSGADVIISNVIGDSVVAMHKEYINQGLTPDSIPIVSSALNASFIAAMGADVAQGNYYFSGVSTLDDSVIQEFKDKMYEKYGDKYTPSNSTYTYYAAVYLWASAMEKAYADGDTSFEHCQELFKNASYGDIVIDPETNHAYAYAKVQKVLPDGTFENVAESTEALKPDPYAY